MAEKSYAQIQRDLRAQDLSALEPLRIAVLRNVTVEPIEPYLADLAHHCGCRGEVAFGGFDAAAPEAMAGAPDLLSPDTTAVLVFLSLEGVSWDLARNFTGLDAERIARETQRIRRLVDGMLAGIRRQTGAMILWHGFETPLYPALGCVDSQREEGQVATVDALNRQLREALEGVAAAYFVDLDLCRARVGGGAFYDLRYWHLGRAPYSRAALDEIAREDFKFIRALKGRNKKCLVLDCDNVLWGGLIGEDGLDGIELGSSYPGSAFREFQHEVMNLARRGVVLALCSKNREEAVWEAFDRHPGMVLGRQHVAAWRINFEDKATNVRELAEELNLGLEHVVFVDDEAFEVELVRSLLPEVTVLHLPRASAVENHRRLASCGLFDSLHVSAVDRDRNALYRVEAQRRRLASQAGDLEDYLRSLEMRLEIRLAEPSAFARIAQLTQRTNQFNLSVRRYSEGEIAELAGLASCDVLAANLRDRFGDCGLVAVSILRYDGLDAVFDTFLLSCRVFGRRVDEAFLHECLARARARGARRAVAEHVATSRNEMAARFFVDRSFRALEAEGEVRRLVLDLATEATRPPGVFQRIDSEVRAA